MGMRGFMALVISFATGSGFKIKEMWGMLH